MLKNIFIYLTSCSASYVQALAHVFGKARLVPINPKLNHETTKINVYPTLAKIKTHFIVRV